MAELISEPMPPQESDARPLRILILEDAPPDADLMERELRKGGLTFTARRADARAGFIEAVEDFKPDVALLDYQLPDFNGQDALDHIRAVHPEIPAVIVTGMLGDEQAIALMKSGAKDYVLKNNLARLPSAVQRAIAVEEGVRARKAAERALRKSHELLKTAERIAHTGGWELDAVKGEMLWSEEVYRIFGRDPRERPPSMPYFLACIHPGDRQRVEGLISRSIAGEAVGFECRVLRPDGTERVTDTQTQIVRDMAGAVVTLIGSTHDVTEWKRAEGRIREEEAKFRSLVEQNVAGVMILGEDARIAYVNPYLAKLAGYGEAEMIGRPLLDLLPATQKASAAATLRTLFSREREFKQLVSAIQTRDGKTIDVIVSARLATFEGRPAALGIFIDITEMRQAEAEVLKLKNMLENAERIGHVAAWEWNIVSNRLYWSEELYRIYGRDRNAFNPTVRDFFASIHPDDRQRVQAAVAAALKHQEKFDIEFRIVRPDGEERITHARAELRLDKARKPVTMIGVSHDITDSKHAEAEVAYMARHDALTGLGNRLLFADVLQQEIAHAHRSGKTFAVLCLDLDHFKDVNDALGHHVGDMMLKGVADRLLAGVREADSVARLGGDEFAIVQTGIAEPGDAATLAEKILKSMAEPYSVAGDDVRTTASIGITMYGPDSPDTATLLSHADVALYRAKNEGRGTYRFFIESMDAEVRARFRLGAELRDAVTGRQMFLVYQPQVDAVTGRIVGVEALVRWRHPSRGIVPPADFIAAAEKSGLIVPIGQWVLEEAARQMREWLDAGIAPPLVGVNLSALQFRTPLVLEREIDAALAAFRLTPEKIELELTESVLMEASREHGDMLRRIRGKGVRIAIDDFGTGYSSLDYLRKFPVDRIKIAQNFVLNLSATSSDAAIVKAAISLAHALNLKTIVEGVETGDQVKLITSWGCRHVQGYYFSKPLPPDELLPILRTGKVVPRGQ